MCGRYARMRGQQELRSEFDAWPSEPATGGGTGRSWPPMAELAADYNIAPGKPVYAVLGRPPNDPSPIEESGSRYLRTLRWGLVPSWAKSPDVGYRMINARGESVTEKPAYRAAFARRRCLLPADAYYEWQLLADGATARPGTSPSTDTEHTARKARSRKRPYAVRYADGRPLALAGVFERWRDPTREEDDPRAWLWTCAIITTEAAPRLSHIHERMPVVVPPQHWDTWLDPAAEPDRLRSILDTTPVERFEIYPVSTDVNSVRNNGPELLAVERSAPADPETLF